MPLMNAQGGIFREWEGLIGACEAHSALLPDVGPLQTALAEILTEAREIKVQQEEHEGRRQAATQQLGEVIERGREAVRRLRGFVKSRLGTRNELLVQFGAAPIRRPARTKAARRRQARRQQAVPDPPPSAAGTE